MANSFGESRTALHIKESPVRSVAQCFKFAMAIRTKQNTFVQQLDGYCVDRTVNTQDNSADCSKYAVCHLSESRPKNSFHHARTFSFDPRNVFCCIIVVTCLRSSRGSEQKFPKLCVRVRVSPEVSLDARSEAFSHFSFSETKRGCPLDTGSRIHTITASPCPVRAGFGLEDWRCSRTAGPRLHSILRAFSTKPRVLSKRKMNAPFSRFYSA